MTARRDRGGMVTVPARACLAIPAVLRRAAAYRLLQVSSRTAAVTRAFSNSAT